jgi:hypothetical protein
VGGLLLYAVGFNKAVIVMAVWLALAFLLTLLLPRDIGRMKSKPAFKALFSKSEGINVLSMARFFLFGARDVWFVVALPVFLQATLGWRFWEVGGFMGLWVIGYGIVQGTAPSLRRAWGQSRPPGPSAVQFWASLLTAIPALMAITLWREVGNPALTVVVGLAVFGVVGRFVDMEAWQPLALGKWVLHYRWAWVMYGSVGFTWCYHLTFTAHTIHAEQGDLTRNGEFFSLMLIFIVNLGLIALLFVAASPLVDLEDVWRTWWGVAQNAWILLKSLFGPTSQW